jgi:hypothetical protein
MNLLETPLVQTVAVHRDETRLPDFQSSSAIKDTPRPQAGKLLIDPKKSNTVWRSIPEATSFEEQIFNALVSLKVAVSEYAMHLSDTERRRIFTELDSIINTEDWHEEDTLPKIEAFRDFLKWMIYSKYNKWISIGVSDEGHTQVAWKTNTVLLTAKFSGLNGQEAVRWTVQIASDKGETGYTVGKCPLRLFSEQALFYLRRAEVDEAK